MPSPFPGMNPYLEHPHVWHDFHGALAYRLRDALAEIIAEDYTVKVDENVYIHELPEDRRQRLIRPDISISHDRSRSESVNTSIALLEAPAAVVHYTTIDELHEKYVTIRDTISQDIVTVIEILSPTNKLTDRDQYLDKRYSILKSPAHLVEIDLLRGGERMPDMNLPPCDYAIMVSRRESRPDAGFWPISVRNPIPAIPIPLRGEGIIRVELKPLIDAIYDAARYQKNIYNTAITPPLPPADAEWAADLLKRAGISAAA